MENLYQNKYAFLAKKPKNLFLVIIFLVIFLIFILVVSLKVKVYDHYLTRGYVDCSDTCKLIVTVPTSINIEKVKIKNKYIKLNTLSKNIELDKERVISYYLYTFDYGVIDKEIIELNFCYNKQRILKKFIDSIFKERM